jgi:hypothetical protein
MVSVEEFARLLSINRQIELYDEGYRNILKDSGVVTIRKGVTYYVISIDQTITYRVRKTDLYVYDFYKKPRGTIQEMIDRLRTKILRSPQANAFKPKITLSTPSPVPEKGFVGRIFWNSWGYDQTNNDFVQVVSETAKQVRVRKVKKNQQYDNMNMTGNEAPVPGAFSSEEFTLLKGAYRDEMILRGVDKSGRGSSQSAMWTLWKGERVGFSSYA